MAERLIDEVEAKSEPTISEARAAKCAKAKAEVIAALEKHRCTIAVEALFSQVRGNQFGWEVVSTE